MRAGLARAGAGLLLLALAGCGAPPELGADTAATLQDGVLAVTEAAAAGQYDVADQELAEVRAALEGAVDDGRVSATRYRVIDDALDRTAAEVAAARAAQQAAAEQAAAEQAAAEQAAAEQAAAEQAAAEQAAAEQAAAEQAAAEQAAAEGERGKGPGGDGGPGKDDDD